MTLNDEATDINRTDTTPEGEDLPAQISPPKRDVSRQIGRYAPENFKQLQKFANELADTKFVPKDYRGNAGNIIAAVMAGDEVGLSPMQSLASVYVVNGRPSLYGDGLLAVVQASGYLEWLQEEKIVEDGEVVGARCTVKRRDYPEPHTVEFTREDAERAGVLDCKPYEPWAAYFPRMCQMRSRAWAIRDQFADVIKGFRVYEEEQDVIEGTFVDSEPEPVFASSLWQEFESRLVADGYTYEGYLDLITDLDDEEAARQKLDALLPEVEEAEIVDESEDGESPAPDPSGERSREPEDAASDRQKQSVIELEAADYWVQGDRDDPEDLKAAARDALESAFGPIEEWTHGQVGQRIGRLKARDDVTDARSELFGGGGEGGDSDGPEKPVGQIGIYADQFAEHYSEAGAELDLSNDELRDRIVDEAEGEDSVVKLPDFEAGLRYYLDEQLGKAESDLELPEPIFPGASEA